MNKSARGNILFLILLAVVLFAALSYAVTSSMRGGGKDASSESLNLIVSRIQNQGIQMRTAIQRMMLGNNLADWQIDYYDANYTSPSANPTCTTDACRLYATDGGNIAGYLIPAKYLTSGCGGMAGGKSRILNMSVKGIGIDNVPDMVLNYGCVSNDLCMAVNDANVIANPNWTMPIDTMSDDASCITYVYGGTLTASSFPATMCPQIGVIAPSLAGKQMFCTYSGTVSTGNIIFYLIQER